VDRLACERTRKAWSEAVRQTLADVARDLEEAAVRYGEDVEQMKGGILAMTANRHAEKFARAAADRYTAAAKEAK
jgi:hypothetical protein